MRRTRKLRVKKETVANRAIFNYMKSDPSWPLFVKNVKKRHAGFPRDGLKCLLGAYGESNYDNSLYWAGTPEGNDYWRKKQEELYVWCEEHAKEVRKGYKTLCYERSDS